MWGKNILSKPNGDKFMYLIIKFRRRFSDGLGVFEKSKLKMI